jgi:O-antigen/teichoic acid export membrane protein
MNVAGKLLNHGIVFLINLLMVRLMGASLSGHYFNELYIFNFIAFFFSLGLDYAAIAWISRQPDLAGIIHARLFRIFLLSMLIFISVVITVLPSFDIKFSQPSWIIILFGSGNLLQILYQGVMSAQKKFNIQNSILIITNVIFLLFLYVLSQNQFINFYNEIVIGYGMLFFLQGVLLFAFSFKRNSNTDFSINWSHFYKHGALIMLSALIYFLFLRIDNYFVERYANALTLGNYVQCGKIGQYFLYFTSVISSTLLPFISSGQKSYSFNEWKKLIAPYVMAIVLLALFLAISGYWLYPFLFGPDFKEMHIYMLILLPGYFCLGLLTLMNAVYIGKGNIKKIFKGDLFGLFLVVTLNSLFVPMYDAVIAALISTFSYVAVFVFLLLDLKKQFED